MSVNFLFQPRNPLRQTTNPLIQTTNPIIQPRNPLIQTTNPHGKRIDLPGKPGLEGDELPVEVVG